LSDRVLIHITRGREGIVPSGSLKPLDRQNILTLEHLWNRPNEAYADGYLRCQRFP
jgi:hypothetical protein